MNKNPEETFLMRYVRRCTSCGKPSLSLWCKTTRNAGGFIERGCGGETELIY